MIRVQYYNNPSRAKHFCELLLFDNSPYLFHHNIVDQTSPPIERDLWLVINKYKTRWMLVHCRFAPLNATPIMSTPLRLLHLKSKSIWAASERIARIEQFMMALSKKPKMVLGGSLGDIFCDFISMSEIDCNNYFEPYKDDLPGYRSVEAYRVHRVFSGLINNNTTETDFNHFMAKHRLIMPQHRYIEDADGKLMEEYICSNLLEICTVSFYKVLQLGCVFRRCQNDQCNRWFVPRNKSDEKYCDNLSPQYPHKSCKEAMRLIKKLEKRLNDETTRHLTILRAEFYNKKIFDENPVNGRGDSFDEFKVKVKTWKKQIENQQETEERFIRWLESCYMRYKGEKVGDPNG